MAFTQQTLNEGYEVCVCEKIAGQKERGFGTVGRELIEDGVGAFGEFMSREDKR